MGKKTDWLHISKEDMQQEIENAAETGKMKIELKAESFLNIYEFKQYLEKEKIGEFIETTALQQRVSYTYDYLIIPSLYIARNKDITCQKDLAIDGLWCRIFSSQDKVIFCLEIYRTPYIKDYDPKNNYSFPFLIVDRKNIKEYNIEEDQKYKAIKTMGFWKNFGKQQLKSLDSNIAFKRLVVGIELGIAIWKGIGSLIVKKKAKLGAHVIDDLIAKTQTEDKTGTIFHLKCIVENKEDFTVSIACEEGYKTHFIKFLQDQWTINTPLIEKK